MQTRPEAGFDATDRGDDLVVDGLIHHSTLPVVVGRPSTWPDSKSFSWSYSSTAVTSTTGRPCSVTTLLVGPKGLPAIGPTTAAPEQPWRNHSCRQARQLFPARLGLSSRCTTRALTEPLPPQARAASHLADCCEPVSRRASSRPTSTASPRAAPRANLSD